MKHMQTLGILISVLMLLALMPNASAADTDTLTITITVDYYDVTLYEDDGVTDYTTWAIGNVAPGSENIMPDDSCIYVKNTGNVSCDFQIKLTEPANWTVSDSSAGEDQFVLMGIFESSATASPTAADFDETNDHINTTYRTATTTVFAGDADGAGVAAGSGVYLYLDLLAPTSQSAAHGQQTITVTIKAVSTS